MTNIRNKTIRNQILIRDMGLCRCCGFKASEVHHIVPLCFGGEDKPTNMVSLCSSCHQDASNTKFEFFKYMLHGGKKIPFLLGKLVQQSELSELKCGGEKNFMYFFIWGKKILNGLREVQAINAIENYQKNNIEDIDFSDCEVELKRLKTLDSKEITF